MYSISILVVLAFAFSCTLALNVALNQDWKLWKETNNKRYFAAEEHVRYAILSFISISDFLLKYLLVVVLSGKVI